MKSSKRVRHGLKAHVTFAPHVARVIAIVFAAAVSCFASHASVLEVVRNGSAVAIIVLPSHPSTVESYAAAELQYHIEASTGTRLQIINEQRGMPDIARIYLGKSQAAGVERIDPNPKETSSAGVSRRFHRGGNGGTRRFPAC